jgi:mannosyltransferase
VWLLFLGSGTPAYEAEIAAPIRERGAGNRLKFLPFVPVPELRRFYCAADLCVYPDATSLSAVEAAGCGRAVIMTDLPASRWRAEMGVGLCYPTGDVPALERAIDQLLVDDDRRIELGRHAEQSVRESFSYDAVARQSETLMYAAAGLPT